MLRYLQIHGSRNVADLADALGVSPSTVRRDLSDLSAQGLLTRVHGGALVDDQYEAERVARAAVHATDKRRIGQAAAELVTAGSTVLINGGTTTEQMLPYLAQVEALTVLTNGLAVAYRLARYQNVSVVVLGGVLRHSELSLLGPIAERSLGDFHVDMAFSGAFGIDAEGGIFGADVHDVGTDRALLSSAERLVVLVDSGKFGHRGPIRLVATEKIAYLITDKQAPPQQLAAMRQRGVEVRTC